MAQTRIVNTSLIPSLFLLHVGSNTGYAIAPLEMLFYKAGLVLGANNHANIHFAYPDLSKGPPSNLNSNFKNIIQFDFCDTSSRNINRLADYVKRYNIRLVLAFDLQPVHPLFSALRKAGVATIIVYWGAPISSLSTKWKLLIKKLQLVTSRSKVDGLIFESEAMAHFAIRGRGIPSHMIDIVPLGVDIVKFRPANSNYVYETFGFPLDRKVILYSGHMERRKGVHILISAAIELLIKRKRKDVCFLLTGNRANESDEYKKMYSGLGTNDLIRFGGYRADMPQLYQSCFCGIIPSSGWDSFTYTSVEMAASGLPIVASCLQGLAEAVIDQETGLLFEPGNVKMLADHIEKLLQDPKLATEFGRQGRIRCEREYSLQIQLERFINVLRKHLVRGFSAE